MRYFKYITNQNILLLFGNLTKKFYTYNQLLKVLHERFLYMRITKKTNYWSLT